MLARLLSITIGVAGCLLLGACGREARPTDEAPNPLARAPYESGLLHLISKDEVDELRTRGLNDPIRQVVEDLRAHPQVIPHAGVLGGTMGFYSDEIYLLNSHTVFARFEDGHIAGSGVFEFTVDPAGKLTWRVLSSTVDDPAAEPAR